MKKQISLIFAIFIVLLMAVLVSADCKISFTSKINDYPGTLFEAGILNTATDNYDLLYDARQPGMPGGKYTQMRTLAGSVALVNDFRNGSAQTWQITKIAIDSDYKGLTGTDSLTWTTDCSDSNIRLSLIDYGNDATRANIVNTINLKETDSYDTGVSAVKGPYRYLDLVLETTVTCTENWQCTAWSKCTEQKQTRTCTDLNNCGTIIDKPAETQSCGNTGSSDILTGSSDILAGSSDIIELNSSDQEITQTSLLDGIVNFFMSLF